MAQRIEEKGLIDTLVHYFIQLLQILSRPWRRTNRCLQICQTPYYPTEIKTRKQTAVNIVALSTDHTVIVFDKDSSVIIPWIFIYVSKPKLVFRSELSIQNNRSSRIDPSMSYSSFELMRERFPTLVEQEYRSCDTEDPIAKNASIVDKQPNHAEQMRSSVKQRFCSRTHRPIQYLPLPHEPHTSTNAECQFMIQEKRRRWTHDIINDTLGRRQNVNPQMRYIKNRLRTFDCRWYMFQFNSYWTQKKYAKSGFYLIDERGNMECYNCGMGLRHDIEDDPFDFHQSFSPHCTATILRDETTNVQDKE